MSELHRMRKYQHYLESLVNSRFNFFLVFFGVAVAGASASNNSLHIALILTIATFVCIPLAIAIARAQFKMDLAFAELLKDPNEPTRIIDDLANKRFIPSMRQWVGCWIPLLCCVMLFLGALVAWLEILYSATSSTGIPTTSSTGGLTHDSVSNWITIELGLLSSGLASVIVLWVQRRLVTRQAGRIIGEWNAYSKMKDQRWIPMTGTKFKAGPTSIKQPSRLWRWWWCGPANHLVVEAYEVEIANGSHRQQHTGEILLDAPHCRHGIRTIRQDDTHYVQEIWVLSKDKIRVQATSSDSTPVDQLGVHMLVREGSDTEKDYLNKSTEVAPPGSAD